MGSWSTKGLCLTHCDRRHLAGTALDVLCNERSGDMEEHPLVAYALAHDNLLVTPHIGGCTVESMEKTEMFIVRTFCGVLLGKSGHSHDN